MHSVNTSANGALHAGTSTWLTRHAQIVVQLTAFSCITEMQRKNCLTRSGLGLGRESETRRLSVTLFVLPVTEKNMAR